MYLIKKVIWQYPLLYAVISSYVRKAQPAAMITRRGSVTSFSVRIDIALYKANSRLLLH